MSANYINPALPSMIRGLYKADLREKSIQNMLDLAADLVQELIDLREQADREPSDAAELEAARAVLGEMQNDIDFDPEYDYWEDAMRYAQAALLAAQEVRNHA